MDRNTRRLYLENEDEGQNQGPQVDSTDFEERIAARRARIANRVASMKPGYFEEKHSDEDETLVEKLAPVQFSSSMQRIVNLCRNGDAFLTNIKVACDARENLRRMEEDELAMIRNQRLEIENNESGKVFKEIDEKWTKAEKTSIAHDLHDLLEEQKSLCAQVMDEKNKLIYEIQLELKAKDDHFVKELKKRSEDVEIMIERMESQMKSMQRAYNFEIKDIEKAYLQDRENMLNDQNADWEALIAELRKKQTDYLEERKNRILEIEELIKTLRTNHTEEFNALKLKLMQEVQQMETDLQQMKATYQLNLEKLEYNFQVLKRRDEENTLTRSQQKRKITQLQDQLNRLHVKGKKQEESIRRENEILSEDYKKMMEAFRDLQKKSKVLIESEERYFRDIWNMNEDELRKDSQRLLDADRIISEQQLGITWIKPDVSFMNNNGPISLAVKEKRDNSFAAAALKFANKSASQPAIMKNTSQCILPTSILQVTPEIVQKFINMLCFEPDFLIEEKMKKLLKVMPLEDQKLIRLDSVLTVLDIHNEEQLDKLFTYFLLPCDQLKPKEHAITEPYLDPSIPEENASATDKPVPLLPSKAGIKSIGLSSSFSAATTITTAHGHRSMQHDNDEERAGFGNQIINGEVRLIDTVDVARTLHRFAIEVCSRASPSSTAALPAAISKTSVDLLAVEGDGELSMTTEGAGGAVRLNTSLTEINKDAMAITTNLIHPNTQQQDALGEEMDRQHWKTYVDTLADRDKNKFWSGLTKALKNYHQILVERSELIVGNKSLRNQNAELKHLLKCYMDSGVKHQMEVCPLSTMKL